MICICGYEAESIEPAESQLGPHHDIMQHYAYVLGASNQLMKLLSEYDLTPKEESIQQLVRNPR